MTNDLVSGGNIHISNSAIKPGKTGITLGDGITILIMALLGVTLLVFLIGNKMNSVNSVNTDNSQNINIAVSNTIQRVNDAISNNIPLTDIIQHASNYTSANPNIQVSISAGSCDSHTPTDYTVTATDKNKNLVIYASTVGNLATGTTANKTAVLTQACGH